MEKYASVVINETESGPLGDFVIDYLWNQKKECPYMDIKFTMHVAKDSDFPEIAKDIFAFSNYGGGWILLGLRQELNNLFTSVGLPDDYNVDQATLQEKFNSFSNTPLEIKYTEFYKEIDGVRKRFALLFIPPSPVLLMPKKEGSYKKGTKERVVFRSEDIFYRRGTQSIPASDTELGIIKKRLEQESYRLSILSGEPDKVNEEIISNLFEVVKLPKYIYSAASGLPDSYSMKETLKQNGVFPEFFFKFTESNGKVITFENLDDESNPYSKLIIPETVRAEPIENWLAEPDKRRVIIELLNKEIRHHAIQKGIFYNRKHDKLFYSTNESKRRERWKSRFRESEKTVAAKMYAEQLHCYVFCHPAFYVSFIEFNNKIFMKILPTFLITEDGKNGLSGPNVGTIITRLSYNRYNQSYRNTILFWIHKLGEGSSIKIKDYLEISSTPVGAKMNFGIIFDAPASQLSLDAEESFEPVEEANLDD